jgi:uncharacterized protein (UPF0335 family)
MPKFKHQTTIVHMNISEKDYMANANAVLKDIEERIEKLQEEKHDLLNAMHIAELYYKNAQSKPHKPSQKELEDLFGDGQ